MGEKDSPEKQSDPSDTTYEGSHYHGAMTPQTPEPSAELVFAIMDALIHADPQCEAHVLWMAAWDIVHAE